MSEFNVAAIVVVGGSNNGYGDASCDVDAGVYFGGDAMVVPMAPRRGVVPQFGIPGSGRPYGSPARGAMPFIPPALARTIFNNPNIFNGGSPNFGLNAANLQNQLLMQLLQQYASNNNINIGNGNSIGNNSDLLLGYMLGREEAGRTRRVRNPRPPVTPPTTPPTGFSAEQRIKAVADLKAVLGAGPGFPANPGTIQNLLNNVPAADRIGVLKDALIAAGVPATSLTNNNQILDTFRDRVMANQPDQAGKDAAGTTFLNTVKGLMDGGQLQPTDLNRQITWMKAQPATSDYGAYATRNSTFVDGMAAAANTKANSNIAGPRVPLTSTELNAKKDDVKAKLADLNTNPDAFANALSSLKDLPEEQKIQVLRTALANKLGILETDSRLDSPEKVRKELLKTVTNSDVSWAAAGRIMENYMKAFGNGNQVMLQNDINYLRNIPQADLTRPGATEANYRSEYATILNSDAVRNATPEALR